jgi:hypothetical protein
VNPRWVKLGLAFCSIAAVSMLAVIDLERKSPGELTRVHGREEELAGKANCSACHGGWFTSMTDRAWSVTPRSRAQIEAREGLHGSLGKARARDCSTCHSEHHGAGFAIVNRQSFALAGSTDPLKFDHRLVGFEMDGAHLELECARCHAHSDDVVLGRGARRFIGPDQECSTCHEDVHQGRMVVSCASCHGQTTWDGLHSLGHERQLPLVGGHGDVACRTCHVEGSTHSLEALGAGATKTPARTCVDCHESPHALAFVAESARQAGRPTTTVCVTCHAAEHRSFRDEHLVLTPEQHAASGFTLDAPHDQVQCARCHAPEPAEFEARYPGRGADQCSACHADPHGGQFQVGPFAGGDCIACHDRLHFAPHAFTAELHQRAALPLSGKHAETECNECHKVAAEGEPRLFHGTPNTCERCHQDAHEGFFDAAFATLAPPKQGACAQCHDATSFAAVPAASFDHGRWTGFAVLGAHAQSGCESCHVPAGEPDERGRTFGRVSAHFGPFRGCVTCHQDPHGGQFDGDLLPRELEGRADCAALPRRGLVPLLPARLRSRPVDRLRAARRARPGRLRAVPRATAPARRARPDLGTGARRGLRRLPPRAARRAVRSAGPDRLPALPHRRGAELPRVRPRPRLALPAQRGAPARRVRRLSRARARGRRRDRALHALGTQCMDCHGVHEEVLLRQPTRGK